MPIHATPTDFVLQVELDITHTIREMASNLGESTFSMQITQSETPFSSSRVGFRENHPLGGLSWSLRANQLQPGAACSTATERAIDELCQRLGMDKDQFLSVLRHHVRKVASR